MNVLVSTPIILDRSPDTLYPVPEFELPLYNACICACLILYLYKIYGGMAAPSPYTVMPQQQYPIIPAVLPLGSGVVPRVATAPQQLSNSNATAVPWPSSCPVARFGIGGKLIVAFPASSSPNASHRTVYARNNTVTVLPVSSVIGKTSYYQQYSTWPGCMAVNTSPATKWPTPDHKKYIDDVLANVSSSPEDTHMYTTDKWSHLRHEEGNVMLWRITKMVCDALLSSREGYKKTAAQVMAEGSKAALMQQITVIPRQTPNLTAGAPEDPTALPEVQNLLLNGRLDAACELAIRVCTSVGVS